LLLTALLPIAGALFALVLPDADRLALRYAGMAASLGGATCGLTAVWTTLVGAASTGGLDVAGGLEGSSAQAWAAGLGSIRLVLQPADAPLLATLVLVSPFALRAGAPRVHVGTRLHVACALFAQGLGAAALLLDDPFVALSVACIAAVPLFALVALFGGPLRGTATYRSAVLWILCDALGLATLVWLASRKGVAVGGDPLEGFATAFATLPEAVAPWAALCLCAPGLVRLAAGPFSVWLPAFMNEAPVSAAALWAGVGATVGVHLLAAALSVVAPGLAPVMPVLFAVAALSLLLSGLIAIAERDLRRLLVQLCQLTGVAAAAALLIAGPRAAGAVALHVACAATTVSLVLVVIEAIERRFETRDGVELAGLGHLVPLLAALLATGLIGLIGVPVVGAGSTLWALVQAVAQGSVPSLPPLAPLWVATALVAAHVLAGAGVSQTLRRLWLPAAPRPRLAQVAVSLPQALRLLVPAMCAIAAGAAAPILLPLLDALSMSAAWHN
jgi:formate hydrogenlyase subunit 3/multisubunit Na+/H+ antiporter MnhD subunit